MCVGCIRSKVDISEGIQKQAILQFCKGCERLVFALLLSTQNIGIATYKLQNDFMKCNLHQKLSTVFNITSCSLEAGFMVSHFEY